MDPSVAKWDRMYHRNLALDVDWKGMTDDLQQLLDQYELDSSNTARRGDRQQIKTVQTKLQPAIDVAIANHDFFLNDYVSDQVMQIHLWATQSRAWLAKKKNQYQDPDQNQQRNPVVKQYPYPRNTESSGSYCAIM